MHISVQQGVDKINSMHSDLILPEEIDLELNKNIQRFTAQKFSFKSNRHQEGFEMSQKRIDDLRTLIVEDSISCFYKGEVFKNVYADTRTLPDNYMHLINVKSLVSLQKCNKFCYDIDSTAYRTSTKLVIDLAHCTPAAFPGFQCFITPQYGSGAPIPITLPTSNMVTSAALLVAWLSTPYNWLSGVTITVTGNNEITITLPVSLSNYLGYYHVFDSGTGPASCNNAFSRQPGVYGEKRVPCDDVETSTLVGQNKFAQHDDIFTLLSDPFNNTTYKYPLYTIRDNSIDVYSDETFVIDRVKITYLRMPAIVNNVDTTIVSCDLPDHTHHEIVQMTVNSILEGISDPRYQSTNMEVLKSE